MARACERERPGASRDRGGVSHGGSHRGANSGTDRATDSATAHRAGRAGDGRFLRTEPGRRVSQSCRPPRLLHHRDRSSRRSAPERYLLRVTLSRDAHDKLERARALLRHTIPNGDPATVIDRALTALVEQLEKRKIAATSRPRKHASRGVPNPPCARRRQARGVGARPGPMRLRRNARPLRRDGLPRVSSCTTVRRRRRDGRRQSAAPMPRAQRA